MVAVLIANMLQAESVCYQQYDAHLSSVLSDDEQTFLAGKSAALHKGLWIGLSDTVSRTVTCRNPLL